jgi:phosphonoacetaldehyde dehydrogenase
MKFHSRSLANWRSKVQKDRVIEVHNPFTGEVIGSVPKADVSDVRQALEWAKAYRPRLSRYERSNILMKAAEIVVSQAERISDLITLESGLCKKDSLYEAGRVRDVLDLWCQCSAAR